VTALAPVHLQPLLQGETIVLRAPVQAWSGASGAMGAKPIHGVYLSDTRILRSLTVTFDGLGAEAIATVPRGPDSVEFVGVLRHLDDRSPDPHVRVTHGRTVTVAGVDESITLSSLLGHEITTDVRVALTVDATAMATIKAGDTDGAPVVSGSAVGADWGAGSVHAKLTADADVQVTGSEALLGRKVTVPPGGTVTFGWHIAMTDSSAVVAGAARAADWNRPRPSGDDRLDRWMSRALDDLDALRMTTTAHLDEQFLAAGAPWFFTLFGRDSLWSARFLVPLGGTIAADTLRVLARMQGISEDPTTAEQPGKIMHELRRAPLAVASDHIVLPPLYYGTVDATALWICLLCDVAERGLPSDELEPLLPHLEAALEWMRDYGDADGDGLLEYIDVGGLGLANQGWKDSRDSVQWKNGELATAPIALCEVQAYAYEASTRAADLLDRFGRPGEPWRAWARRLRNAFHEKFWITDEAGDYPAIALDFEKKPVDSLTSNIGHLLGTGLLDDRQSALVAARLVSPELNSGYGLRTMSTASAGYWPLSYHGGSVWSHDTAIAIRGLANSGFSSEARALSEGLLAAAASFDYRMPELHSGDPATEFSRAVPYPAACRPQAWSAAAAIAVLSARGGTATDQ
jgi:glycogen debranching enzyme